MIITLVAGDSGHANNSTPLEVWSGLGLVILLVFIFVTKACAKRTGAAASVERRRRERRTLLAVTVCRGGGRASRSDTLAASHAFQRMHVLCLRITVFTDGELGDMADACGEFREGLAIIDLAPGALVPPGENILAGLAPIRSDTHRFKCSSSTNS